MKRLLALIFYLFVIPVLTSPGLAIQVMPTYQLFSGKPGDKIVGELTLLNTEDQDLTVSSEVKDWFVLPANNQIKTADWLKINVPPFTLKKGESKLIRFTAEVPKKATGEIMGMLSFVTKNETSSMITFRLSVAVYVVIKGTEKIDGEVIKLSVALSSNTDVGITLLNTGNVHIRPKGLIQIKDKSGEVVANIVLEQGPPAFPGIPRYFFGQVKNYVLPEGRYLASITLSDIDHNAEFSPVLKKFSIGKDGKVRVE